MHRGNTDPRKPWLFFHMSQNNPNKWIVVSSANILQGDVISYFSFLKAAMREVGVCVCVCVCGGGGGGGGGKLGHACWNCAVFDNGSLPQCRLAVPHTYSRTYVDVCDMSICTCDMSICTLIHKTTNVFSPLSHDQVHVMLSAVMEAWQTRFDRFMFRHKPHVDVCDMSICTFIHKRQMCSLPLAMPKCMNCWMLWWRLSRFDWNIMPEGTGCSHGLK